MSEQYIVELPGFPYFWGYSAAFLFLVFLSSESSSSCVKCLSFMSICLRIILVIGSYVTFGGFPSKFSKGSFYNYIRSCLLVAFSLVFAGLFLLPPLFTVCHAILDCLSSTKSLILLIWICMYFVCSFRYMLANSFWVFLSFRALILKRFFFIYILQKKLERKKNNRKKEM